MLHIIHLSPFCPPKVDVALKITIGSKPKSDISKMSNATHHPLILLLSSQIYDRSLLNFDPMVILRATSILGGQKVDKRMMCSITHQKFNGDFKSHINFGGTKGGQWDDM